MMHRPSEKIRFGFILFIHPLNNGIVKIKHINCNQNRHNKRRCIQFNMPALKKVNE